MNQSHFHMPGWPELSFHGHAETDGRNVWWWEERQADGSIKRYPLQPYDYIVEQR